MIIRELLRKARYRITYYFSFIRFQLGLFTVIRNDSSLYGFKINVPNHLHRNHHRNHHRMGEIGYEHSGEVLINLVIKRLGLKNLQNKDILDVGCGIRLTMAIINREIPIKTYSGIEVYKPVIDFLKENVSQEQFQFEYWNIHNNLYNPNGVIISEKTDLPFEEKFDIIWLFSVFTHLNPKDSIALLKLIRKYIRKGGRLFFSAFIDQNLETFEDRIIGRPLLQAYYSKD